jgi:hypothetical protein
MHGFNQGYSAINELMDVHHSDVFLLQEHWLTPANLNKFNVFPDYLAFGYPAMNDTTESGILFGRPYGGVTILININLRNTS